MNRLIRLLLFCVVLASIGCSSFKTNFLFRSEDNSHWQREKHLKGVPVTLKIPTHVRIDVIEKRYIFLGVGQKGIVDLKQNFPLRSVEYTPIETEKMFLVDLKRPAAGTIDATLDFDAEQQYFNKIQNNVTDQTVDAVSALLEQVAPSGLLGAPTNEGDAATNPKFSKRIKEVTTVVASKVFEFDSPGFEDNVTQFLCDHLNGCHNCNLNDLPLGVPNKSEPATEQPSPEEATTVARPQHEYFIDDMRTD